MHRREVLDMPGSWALDDPVVRISQQRSGRLCSLPSRRYENYPCRRAILRVELALLGYQRRAGWIVCEQVQ